MNPDDAFERILAALYEAALDDTRWSAATSLIEEALDASGSALGVIEVGDDDVLNVRVHFARFLRRGDSYQDLMREYLAVHHPHDEAMPRASRLPHAGALHPVAVAAPIRPAVHHLLALEAVRVGTIEALERTRGRLLVEYAFRMPMADSARLRPSRRQSGNEHQHPVPASTSAAPSMLAGTQVLP